MGRSRAKATRQGKGSGCVWAGGTRFRLHRWGAETVWVGAGQVGAVGGSLWVNLTMRSPFCAEGGSPSFCSAKLIMGPTGEAVGEASYLRHMEKRGRKEME